MKFSHLLFLLFLFSTFSFSACPNGYNDSFYVRVLDAKFRPVEGAAVSVRFDRGVAAGDFYYTIPYRYTDSSGKYFFQISNEGAANRVQDCKIYFTVSKGGSINDTHVVEALAHGNTIDINLINLYPITIVTKDAAGAFLPNVSLSIDNVLTKTDQFGFLNTHLSYGPHSYVASHLESKKTGTINVVDDLNYEVSFSHYDVTIEVIDDSGKPLNASVNIFGKIYYPEDGKVSLRKVFSEEIDYEINYEGVVKKGTIIPSVRTSQRVIYDFSPPTLGTIKNEQLLNVTRLIIPVTDQGQFASGLDQRSVKVSYRIEPDSNWANAVVFTSGKDLFTAELKDLPSSKVVQFRVELKDKEGNKASIDGRFSTFTPIVPIQPLPTTSQPTDQGFPFLYIVIGIILLALFIFVAKNLIFNGGSGG